MEQPDPHDFAAEKTRAEGPHAEIAQLERALEELADAETRCRKLDIGAKLALGLGAIWLAAPLLGLTRGEAASTLLAIAAVLGGIVLYGSNRSTWAKVADRRKACEARRAELIDALDMQLVRAVPPSLRHH